MVAKYTLDAHLSQLNNFIKELDELKKKIDKKIFFSDKMIQAFVERRLQLTIEAMLTIGEMIIAQKGSRKPVDNNDIFDILAEMGVYPKTFAQKLWGAGGFRNILVHNYIDLDLEKVYYHLINSLPIFKKYAQYAARWNI
ncbi:MAG: DUF86 domain-containing protein [bacterium]